MSSIRSKQHRVPCSRASYAPRSPARSSFKQRSAPSVIRLATSSPRPGLPAAQHGRSTSKKAGKIPTHGAGPRVFGVKHGKAARRAPMAKQGGSAKPAKVHLPKLAALPTPVPGRRTLPVNQAPAAPSRPTRMAVRAAAPKPAAPRAPATSSGPSAASGESPGEDDTPGIDAAGDTAGGGQLPKAQTVAPQAPDTTPQEAEAPRPARPAAHSPEHLLSARTRVHVPPCTLHLQEQA